MSEVYDKAWSAEFLKAAFEKGVKLNEGAYARLRGRNMRIQPRLAW